MNSIIHTEHRDVIHDCSYDYYGQRMATCSSDQTIKVWEQNEKGQWIVSSSWKAHSGSIWKLNWAHPEFGAVIVSASFDRTASIWEETAEQKPTASSTPAKRWIRRTNLVDSRTSVTDVKFGPKNLGLVLATSSSDGIIRIYEAPDIMNLSQWTLQHEIICKLPLSCISWNPSLFRAHPPMIAAGSDMAQSNEPKVFVFEYSEYNRRWTKTENINVTEPVHSIEFAPNVGRSYHVLAVASKDVSIFNLKPIVEQSGNTRFEVVQAAQFNDNFCTVWRVTWNITGSMLVTSSDDGYVRIWRMNYLKGFKCICSYKPDSNVNHHDPQAVQLINSSTTKFFKKGVGAFAGSSQIQQH
jgi:nucleoporin SEH1